MRFRGDYAFLSNFHPATVTLNGDEYPTVEHAYQAAKTLDDDARDTIRRASTPAQAKRLGRQVLLRPEWNNLARQVMLQLLYQKFSSAHPALLAALLDTDDEPLIEENTWCDIYWGRCVCPTHRLHPDGAGSNHLGRLLMQVRTARRGSP